MQIKKLLLLFCTILLFPILSTGVKSPIVISPLEIVWNDEINRFEAIFEITNVSEETLNISCILRFTIKKKRRWRGLIIPPLKKGNKSFYKIQVPPNLLLKNNYSDISLIVYQGKYEKFITSTRNNVQFKTKRKLTNGSYQVQIEKTVLQAKQTIQKTTLINVKRNKVNLASDSPSEIKSFVKQQTKEDTTTQLWQAIEKATSTKEQTLAIVDSSTTITDVESDTIDRPKEPIEVELIPEEKKMSTNEIELLIQRLYSLALIKEFQKIEPSVELSYNISNQEQKKSEILKKAKALQTGDLQNQDALIALYVAEGESGEIAELLSGQLDKTPENINLSISLSKVYHEQGNTEAALDTLTSSLSRISLSARLALNQELKTSIKEGKSTIKIQSEEAFLANEFQQLGQSLINTEKFSEALSAFQSLNSLIPDYPLINYYMGQCRFGLSQFNQAKLHFINQIKQPNKPQQQFSNLEKLSQVLPKSLEIKSVELAIKQYEKLQKAPELTEQQDDINAQLMRLTGLYFRVKNRRLDNMPDLVISPIDKLHYTDAQAEQKIQIPLSVNNIGKKKSGSYKVYYQLIHENGTTFDISETDNFPEIAPDSEKFTWVKQLTIPAKALPGKYALAVNIEQQAGSDEFTLDNNAVTSNTGITIIEPIAELKVLFKSPLIKHLVDYSKGFSTDLVVENNGHKSSPKFQLEYYFENKEGDYYTILNKTVLDAIPQHNFQDIIQQKIELPETFEKGLYKLHVRLVIADEASEYNKSNNEINSAYIFEFKDRFEGNPAAGIAYYLAKTTDKPSILNYRIKLSQYYSASNQDKEALATMNSAAVIAVENQATIQPNKINYTTQEIDFLKRNIKTLGDNYYQSQQYQFSLSSYQSLKVLDPNYPFINKLSGYSRIGLKQYRLAKLEFINQVNITPDFESLVDLKNVLSYDNDIEFIEQTKEKFQQLNLNDKSNTEGIDNHIKEIEQLIEDVKTRLASKGSDLNIAIENSPTITAIKPNATISLKFSLNNLGTEFSNPVTVHYQFANKKGAVFDSEISTKFDRINPKDKTTFWFVNLIVPDNIIGGKYQVKAIIEFESGLTDKIDSNNQTVSNFNFVYNEPDLAITQFSYQIVKVLENESLINFQVAWENRGANPATDNYLKLFIENTRDKNDKKLLKSISLVNIDAVSETKIISNQLTIQKITNDNLHKLVAVIETRGSLKENFVENNRFTNNNTISKKQVPVNLIGLVLKNEISYPGKENLLEIHVRNNQSKNVNDVNIGLSLINQKGEKCCTVTRTIPKVRKIKNNSFRYDHIFKTAITFPEIAAGDYYLEAEILSTSEIKEIQGLSSIKSTTALHYGKSTFSITNFYPIRNIIIPGKSIKLNVSILNNGEDKSLQETLKLYLEGEKQWLLGTIDIEPMNPDNQSVTLNKVLKIPSDIPFGDFTLVLKKEDTRQGKEQVLRYRDTILVKKIQITSPSSFEAFKQNTPPYFAWNSINGLDYKMAFSSDPLFKDENQVLKFPDENWLQGTQYQVNSIEWKLIWILYKTFQKPMYWRIEGRTKEEKIIYSEQQKIILKNI